MGWRQKRERVFYTPTVWNFSDLTTLMLNVDRTNVDSVDVVTGMLKKNGGKPKKNICDTYLNLDNLNSSYVLLFIPVDSCQSTGKDSEKMIVLNYRYTLHHNLTLLQLACEKIIVMHAWEISTEWGSFPIGSLNVVSLFFDGKRA